MTKLMMTKWLLGFTAAALMVLSGGTATASPAPQWRGAHKTTIDVRPARITHWRSKATFASDEVIETAYFSDGKELHSSGAGCSVSSSGAGVLLSSNTCGRDRVHLRLQAISTDGKTHRLRIVYRRLGAVG